MEMRHIRAFLAVAEELHFGRAAARLHIAQPAVSAAIAQLEAEVGAVLFDRTRRQVALSAAGAHLRPALESALATLGTGIRAAQRAASGETGRIVVYFTAMAAFSKLPEALASLRARRPDVQVIVKQAGTAEQLEALRAGRCDFGITILPGDVRPLQSAPFTRDRLVAVVPRKHRLARTGTLRFAEIANEPVLLLPRSSEPAVHRSYLRLCAIAGVEPRVAMELEQTESMLAFVAAGLGIAFMPSSISRLGSREIVGVPLVPTVEAESTLVWDPSRSSAAGRELLQELLAKPTSVNARRRSPG
jgi:DNA-binding transcriptional LysR family regulator